MSFKSVVALFIMAFVLVCFPVFAQDEAPQEEENFKLLRGRGHADLDLEISDEEDEAWIPAIKKGTVEVSFAMGTLGLSTTLLEHDQIIYKFDEEATYWGDMKINGAGAFHPQMRLGYNISTWLCVEAIGGFSFSEYSSSVENRSRRSNEPGAPVDFDEPALGEFDLETRSLLTANVGINASVYFLNLDGDGTGRFQPYATGGVGNVWYSMNSNYVEEAASTLDFNLGGGVRLLADRNISIRLEAVYHLNTVEFTPSYYFTELNEGTVQVPTDEFPIIGEVQTQTRVEEFTSQTIGCLGVSIGLQGSF